MKLDLLCISILLCTSFTLDSTIILSTHNLFQSSTICFVGLHLQQLEPSAGTILQTILQTGQNTMFIQKMKIIPVDEASDTIDSYVLRLKRYSNFRVQLRASLRTFQEHLTHKILLLLVGIQDLGEAGETTQYVLTKENLDKQLAG